ncbi:hypothetical protein AXG93_402s1130 [Marchantia polymorpha subsp. ruderalis]|uniref:Reverse transcriptase/retrotransposon-derived protein RNase H-like domain-containing protein n=1 Tax=Marchantia polymorpha subsp. ruderalis TaxID=1480154 RepID=A0A176WBZ3_MARPO|nr:hypothetical protein AXG93_402s1130 [Marchantia polymorpha subsp. ruderalis]
MVDARAFMKAAKNGRAFAIYAISTFEPDQGSTKLPTQYEEYRDMFEEKNADRLPQHQPYDCGIELQEGAQPLFGPIYGLSHNAFDALREYLDKNFAKNFIQHSKSLAEAPILFVKKKDGSLRMCVEYRGLKKDSEANQAFVTLKKAFTTTPILTHPDFQRPFFLETDASDFALRAVL